jgi:hypothetical protein
MSDEDDDIAKTDIVKEMAQTPMPISPEAANVTRKLLLTPCSRNLGQVLLRQRKVKLTIIIWPLCHSSSYVWSSRAKRPQ